MAPPWGGAWSIANWDDLQLTFWPSGTYTGYLNSVGWVMAEVAGHGLQTCPANDNDAAEHSDETGNCPEARDNIMGQVV